MSSAPGRRVTFDEPFIGSVASLVKHERGRSPPKRQQRWENPLNDGDNPSPGSRIRTCPPPLEVRQALPKNTTSSCEIPLPPPAKLRRCCRLAACSQAA